MGVFINVVYLSMTYLLIVFLIVCIIFYDSNGNIWNAEQSIRDRKRFLNVLANVVIMMFLYLLDSTLLF